MDRRKFLSFAAAATPAHLVAAAGRIPAYRVVTSHKPVSSSVPGPFPGRVASVRSERCIDAETDKVDRDKVTEMVAAGMKALTGEQNTRAAWSRFFDSSDVVGIKINASGAPNICSAPEVVGEVAANLVAVGVRPDNIWVYERNKIQVDTVPYAAHLPAGAHVVTADAWLGYDPFTYVDVSFFGEDDTRSNIVRLVSDKLTKIVNIPNMKDHGASGVTGCLKNIAYGSFGNVARSHQYTDTHTLSFIATLAAVEPLRSRTVLHINDGLRGIWHGGPFMHQKRFRFYPKQMLFSTDPVASDRLLIDIIEAKRAAEKAISVWDRSEESLGRKSEFASNPNANSFKREPGHIEYAGKLGLGVYDKAKIDLREIVL
ncbi:MAG: DUF362 domain-containing protein [Bryobacteraceae bacterium]|nr:DUF362 domain-containing protein [Bryobacteraceae bacterium]